MQQLAPVLEKAPSRSRLLWEERERATDKQERSLERWISNEKRAMKSGELNPEREEMMQQLALVLEKAPSRSRLLWEERLSELQSWIEEHGSTLSSKYATEKQERSLAAWLTDQKRAMKSGELSPERKRLMQQFAPVLEKTEFRS
eukprot:TRINITY_DN10918_c0_g1_i4.p1 TRINITY_DN10918_c0_g1~~TRINITY_DN10918_c0_g1_i4.p1  ORF type:complete len:145 (-),score=36.02 TRINITY_DN10918_c0_g1_i4:119-553(-)